MNLEEENRLLKAVTENLSIPIELNTHRVRAVVDIWQSRLSSEVEGKVSKAEASLKKYWSAVAIAVEKVVKLDRGDRGRRRDEALCIDDPRNWYGWHWFCKRQKYPLVGSGWRPKHSSEGGSNQLQRGEDYFGKNSRTSAQRSNAYPGQTAGARQRSLQLLQRFTSLPSWGSPSRRILPRSILFQFISSGGGPTRRVGQPGTSAALIDSSFCRHAAETDLLDEFEALTEPGAAGRIVASIINHVATGSIGYFSLHISLPRFCLT